MITYFNHQQEIIDKGKKRVGYFLGTGSGKTRIAVNMAEDITIVVCPKTQSLDGTWTDEWAEQKKTNKLYVISKEQFKIQYKKGILPKADTIILDESHTICGVTPYTRQKNYIKFPKTSQVFEIVKRYITENKPKRVYLLSATPDSEPMKVWAAAQLLGASWDFFKFRDTFYFEKTVRGRLLYLVNRSQKNKDLMGKLIRRLGYVGQLSDWFDVPDQTFKTHQCGVSAAQEAEYQELKMLYPDPMVQAGKTHQLEQGIFEGELIKETKFEVLKLYQQEFKRVVIFAKYTKQIELYRDLFEKDGKKVFVLNGQTKDKERESLTKDAEASDECVFIAQSSISAGWELPTFPAMIFASLDHSFTNYDQAIGRVQRVHNIKKNIYIFLVAGKTDKKVKTVVDAKQNFSEAKFAKEFGEELAGSKKLA